MLYDERVNTYHHLLELNAVIDEKPELYAEFVALDIRNHLAHLELQNYQDKREFLGKHYLVQNNNERTDERARLIDLRRCDPAAFSREYFNLMQHISKTESHINTGKAKDVETLERWREKLSRLKLRLTIFEDLISR